MTRCALLLLSFCILISPLCFGQSIEWAGELVKYSTQYDAQISGAKQVLGAPNKYPAYGQSDVAWAPKTDGSNTTEFVRVRFNKPSYARQVVVAETLNPGAIYQIFLYDEKGKSNKVYENKTPKGVLGGSRLFSHTFGRTSYKVHEAKIVLKTKEVQGRQQIDAIGISESTEPVKIDINIMTYAEKVAPPENLGPNVNTKYAERLPIISPDGQTLYFARKWHPDNLGEENQDDIWVSKRQANDTWSRATNIGTPLNNDKHNFVCAISPDGQTIYLANDYSKKAAKDGLSIAQKRRNAWAFPKLLNIKNHYNENPFVCYHVSVNGKTVVMTVEREGGLGDRDIYVSHRYADGTWGEPKNLGKTINTSGMEASVFLAADGKTIYFSSNGHRGYGGLDVFMSRRLDNSWENWTTPLNLGPQINKKGHDFNYTIPASGEYAYFSSDFEAMQTGMSNLYRIRLPKEVQPEPVTLLKGRLLNAETNQPIEGQLKYKPLLEDIQEGLGQSSEKEGFQVILPYGEDYEISAEIPGFFPVSNHMDQTGIDDIESIDYDGEDPTILSQINPNRPALNFNNSNEIKKLKDQLTDLENDLNDLGTRREKLWDDFNKLPPVAEKEKPKENTYESNPKIKSLKEKYLSLYEDEPIASAPKKTTESKEETKKTKSSPVIVTKPQTVKEQPKERPMTDKEKRYAELFEEEKPKPKTENKPAPKEEETSTVETKPTNNPSIVSSPSNESKILDPEAEEKKRRYEEVFGEPEKEEKPQTEIVETIPAPSNNNQTVDNPPTNNPKELDPEAEEKKRRYEELFGEETPVKETVKEEPIVKEEPKEVVQVEPREKPSTPIDDRPSSPSKEEKPVVEEAKPVPPAGPSFEEIEAKVREDLENELRDEVRNKLQNELIDEVKKELETDLEDDIRDQLQDDMRKNVEDQLRQDLEKQVSDNLRNDLQKNVEDELRNDLKDEVEDELRNQLKKEIEDELRNSLKDQIEDDLRDQLRDPIKEQLKKEMEFRLKKELEQKLRREIEQKLKRQMQEQERDRELAGTPAPKPEEEEEPQYRELEKDILLYPIKVGQIIPMNNIFFDANKTTLKEASNNELNRVLEFLKQNPQLVVEIGGHTNGICSHTFAKELSDGRSQTVAEFLVKAGISAKKISHQGYGKTQPIATNDTIEGRKKNQRVELRIVEILD